MAKYQIKAPDGSTFEVTAPDTASEAEVMDYAQAQFKAAPAAGPPLSRIEKIKQGLRDPIDGLAQMLTNALPDSIVRAGNSLNNTLADQTGLVGKLPEGGVDQQVRENEADYQARRSAAGESGLDGYRLLGNVASPANLAIAARAPVAAGLGGRVAVGALGGGASAAANPVTSGDDFWSEKLKQAELGMAFGGGVPLLTGAASRLISPNASKNADLALLKAEGVRPTIGQTLGGRMNALEEKLQSVPILGDAIANRRSSALADFNNAAVNRAAGKVGASVEGGGFAAVKEAGDQLSKAYEDALSSIKYIKFDKQFQTDLTQLRGMAQALTPPMRNRFNKELSDIVGGRTSQINTMLGDTFKKVDSELGQKAARFQGSAVASEAELGDALKQLQSLVREQAARSNPQAAEAIRAADAGWANLVRVEGAAKAAKNAEGVFTPGQLNTAIQTADKSARKRAVSRGEALLQDLGSAGQKVLGNKVPNSFTTDRALIAGGALGSYLVNPAIPAGLIGGAALYTPQVQKLLAAMASSRPELAEPIAQALRKASPALIPGATQAGLGLLQ